MNRPLARLASLVAAGALALTIVGPAAAATPEKLTAVVAVDDGTPAAGNTWIRVLHGSPDAPQVDVYVGADLASAAIVPDLSGLSFGDISDYVEVPAGTYAVKVCATADSSVCPIEVDSLTVDPDTKYTVAASDLLASIDVNVFVDDTGAADDTMAEVRVVHLSADTPAVDVLTQAGDSIGIDGLTYPNRAPATGYATFPGGDYDLKVCASSDSSLCPIDPGALTLANGTAYSVFAVGSLSASLPAATAPPTDVLAATDADPVSTGPSALFLMVAALSFVGGLAFVTSRTRR